MNQAWHIFKKDLRHLRFEAVLMTALVLAWSQTAAFRKPQTGEALPEGWLTLITAIAAVVDTDAGRRGPKLFRHDENRAARVLR